MPMAGDLGPRLRSADLSGLQCTKLAENSQETARSFREAVIAAYNGRCAISRLQEPLLLDAAHIMADKDERFGHPVIPNGLPMSKIHHAAFDAHLIGIDPDYRLHVSERLLVQKDGPMLEALKRLKDETGATRAILSRHRRI